MTRAKALLSLKSPDHGSPCIVLGIVLESNISTRDRKEIVHLGKIVWDRTSLKVEVSVINCVGCTLLNI